MNKLILTALSALALTATATYANPVHLTADTLSSATTLYADRSDQLISIPQGTISGTLPGDLTLISSGLPRGVSMTLSGSGVRNGTLMLTVDTANAGSTPLKNCTATLALYSGSTLLTVFKVSVINGGHPEE